MVSKIIIHCDDKQFFIFKYVGVLVTEINKPNDLQQKFNKILFDMRSINVQHNDIKIRKIFIYVILVGLLLEIN